LKKYSNSVEVAEQDLSEYLDYIVKGNEEAAKTMESFTDEEQVLANNLIKHQASLYYGLDADQYYDKVQSITGDIVQFLKDNPLISEIYFGETDASNIRELEGLIKEDLI